MELQSPSSLKVGDKVKMKLIQPAIKCSGRGDVTCHYRGKVVHIWERNDGYFVDIKFKYNGKEVIGVYHFETNQFIQPAFKDIKLIK